MPDTVRSFHDRGAHAVTEAARRAGGACVAILVGNFAEGAKELGDARALLTAAHECCVATDDAELAGAVRRGWIVVGALAAALEASR